MVTFVGAGVDGDSLKPKCVQWEISTVSGVLNFDVHNSGEVDDPNL